MDGHRLTESRVSPFQHFGNDAQRNVIHSHTAVADGDADAEKTQLGHLLQDVPIELLFLVQLPDLGTNFLFGKLANRLTKHLVFFGEPVMHPRLLLIVARRSGA